MHFSIYYTKGRRTNVSAAASVDWALYWNLHVLSWTMKKSPCYEETREKTILKSACFNLASSLCHKMLPTPHRERERSGFVVKYTPLYGPTDRGTFVISKAARWAHIRRKRQRSPPRVGRRRAHERVSRPASQRTCLCQSWLAAVQMRWGAFWEIQSLDRMDILSRGQSSKYNTH